MQELRPGFRIFTLFLGLLVGQIVAALMALGILGWYGGDTSLDLSELPMGAIRWILVTSQFFGFLLPGIVLVQLWNVRRETLFGKAYFAWVPWVTVGAYFISLPFFGWTYAWNMSWVVPEWWPFAVEAVPEELITLLTQKGFWFLVANVLAIGLLPAVGEELIFRGLLQPAVQDGLNHKVAGVLVTAAIFSVVHFDFHGLFPRWILGMVLGFAYYYSRSLLWPILIHFIHNGGQVILAYSYSDYLETPEDIDPNMGVWPFIFALVVAFIYLFLHKLRGR
jgi:membrane protease YdiL (CAAX protease family)